MSEVRLAAETRTEFGKGGARRTRRAGKIPAVLYGHGTAPLHLSLQAREFAHALKGGANTVLTLELEGGATQLALPKSVVRHPLRDYVEHVDLVIIRQGEKVTVDIQVVLTGDAQPGVIVLHEANTLSIAVDALSIPTELQVSIAGLEAGAQILASQVELPVGAELNIDGDTLVVGIQAAPTAAELDADSAAGEAELGIERDEHTEPSGS